MAPRWEEFAEEISYGAKGGFYFFESPKHAPKPSDFAARHGRHGAAFPANTTATHAPVLTGAIRWIDQRPAMAEPWKAPSSPFKKPAFGCQACGNCVLGVMEYVAP